MLPSHLVLWDDQLHTVSVIGVGNGVLEKADCADDLRRFLHELFSADLTLQEVSRVADEGVCLDRLVTGPDADKLPGVVDDDFIDLLVEHICATVDCTQPGETLWQLSETVERVDVRRLSVTSDGRRVQEDAVVCLSGGASHVGVIEV